MSKSSIEWTDYTQNFWVGCAEIAPECGIHGGGKHGLCYAASMASRNLPHDAWQGTAKKGEWTGRVNRNSKKVWETPFTWLTQPAKVFTCSMSDFWHEEVPIEWLREALDVIEATPHLTWQIVTKRPGNIQRKLDEMNRTLPANVWQGITLGHSQSLPLLKSFLKVEASVRFLSCEPLLTDLNALPLDGIHWVIAGGQSGKSDLAFTDPDWMRGLRDKCIAAKVPFFLKQFGNWASNPTPRHLELDPKAKGGATLDGRLWREFPL